MRKSPLGNPLERPPGGALTRFNRYRVGNELLTLPGN